jgi:hypothetical protein
MTCVDISDDGCALLGVGLDASSKQLIALWDISRILETRRADLILKGTTEHNVKRAKFSMYEAGKFMTVGRDSIRLYRVKMGNLRGLSIPVLPFRLFSRPHVNRPHEPQNLTAHITATSLILLPPTLRAFTVWTAF